MVVQQSLITETVEHYPGLFDLLAEVITPERAFDVFKSIADTYAPTLTVRFTRGPVVEALLQEAKSQKLCGENLTFHRNYLSSGNVALQFGSKPRKPVWSMAHLDIISFLTGERENERYPLTPYCEARQTTGVRPALALNFSPDTGTMQTIGQGWLHSTDEGHFFETDVKDLPPATRVVYASEASWDKESGMIYGTIDDAFGCAALILAAMVLAHYDVEAMIVLTDEEEGVVGVGNRAFSRGSARLLNRIPAEQLPDLITITDLHEEVTDLAQGNLDQARFGQGSLFAGFASGARGGVTAPQLLYFQRELAQYLATQGISLQENAGYVSRSDCVSAMMATPNVALIGYPGAYSHFIDTPRGHIADLMHLAKVMTIYILVAQSQAWRARYLL
jgi:putative aminopeptidase FrvX